MDELIIAIGLPVLRSVGGWVSYALEDNKISKFELKKLFNTILKTSVYGVLIYLGVGGMGLDIDMIAASASGLIFEKISSSLKNKYSDNVCK